MSRLVSVARYFAVATPVTPWLASQIARLLLKLHDSYTCIGLYTCGYTI